MDTPIRSTFKQMMNEVVDYGSCCECGSCVLVCPHNVIDYINDKPKQVAKESAAFDYCGMSEGIGCDVCAQVCPRLFPRDFQLAPEVFRDEPPVYEGIFGNYRRILVARSSDKGILESGQDGGVVTTMLAYMFEKGMIDGAAVSARDPELPAHPIPALVTSREEVLDTAGSWYTYCPNNLALREAEEKGCEKVAFVGVPCQITPIRKMQQADPAFLDNGKKKPQHVEKQTRFLKSYGDRVDWTIGLLCSEVFTYEGLMVDKIQEDMGVPLSEVTKFNVKGKVLIYKKDGEVVDMPLKRSQEYARAECHHCGDFTGELADISCGGVGTTDWTIVILRNERGEELFDEMVADGRFETRPMEEFEKSMTVLLRLAQRQHERVPVPPGRDPSWVRPPFALPGDRDES
ncbi:MAG: Coenzyme F420 hydrogenase/dehydrogenase, beta subunit C-terminal domain [Candidatus Binatia bacterium]|jgi:coenzyme F420 hydrogenase subunit beta|nr:Coenzyme F420 hydrogenase/dehydrogenase, beta subunit C-terminal domain [Candidatus Binatia bacterium]MDG2010639.1 Coenzyme F420 hydrogenase/dehydrogenase, beta subunit C-terminal domain [Candidatus Binatia bacterium]